MRWLLSLGLLALLALPALQADGLVHRLPDDGTSAKFDLELKINVNGMEKAITGSLTMASVGKTDVDGKQCRWLEFRLQMDADGKEQITIAKALIPEKSLKAGENPGAAMIRGWVKDHEREPMEIKDVQNKRAGALAFLLAGPLDNPKKLAKEALDNKALGKIDAEGVSGNKTFDQEEEKIEAKVETRLHSKAPFGVVQSKLEFQVFRNGEARDQGTMSFKLIATGKDAKSELPDQK